MSNDRLVLKNPGVLRSLQYFESVARHGSVRAAADEHRVSASAISHHMRDLRMLLGEELLVRSGRGLVLTVFGEQLYQNVSRIFTGLDSTLERLVGKNGQLIRLAVCSSFGPAWLAKRLPAFLKTNPSIDVEVRLYATDPLLTESVADAIVTAGEVVAGFESLTLFDEMLVAVGGRDLVCDGKGMPQRLITTDPYHRNLAEDWHKFSRLTGMDYVGAASDGLSRCTHYLVAMALAQSGVGAALVPDYLAADGLKHGDLRLLSNVRMPAERVYKLCYKVARAQDPVLRCLAQWMKSQARFGMTVAPAGLEKQAV
jgi:LysR family glycine cleavage system transcriptional activator